MSLDEMKLPAEIHRKAADIIERIEQATGMLDATMAGGVAEGFLCGIAFAAAINQSDIEQLDDLFSEATAQKMAALRKLG